MIDVILNAIGGRVLLYVGFGLLIICIILGVALEITSSRLDAAQARTGLLGSLLGMQNQAVRKWKAEADKQAQAVAQAAQQRERVRTITVERVREVERAVIPQECPAAVKWAAEQALIFNAEWEAGKP